MPIVLLYETRHYNLGSEHQNKRFPTMNDQETRVAGECQHVSIHQNIFVILSSIKGQQGE